MAIARSHSKKSPTQKPTEFFKLKQFGGARGMATQKVPDKLTGGPMREPVMGKKSLG